MYIFLLFLIIFIITISTICQAGKFGTSGGFIVVEGMPQQSILQSAALYSSTSWVILYLHKESGILIIDKKIIDLMEAA